MFRLKGSYMDRKIFKHSDDFESHIDQIARLKTINWGLDFDVFRSYVKWNYIDQPHSKQPIIYFVHAGNEIVAMRGVYESRWRVKGWSECLSALCSADLLILRKYRNKGIYKELASFVMDDLDKIGARYFLGFNATPLNTIISLSAGWKSVGKIRTIKKQFQTKQSRVMGLVKKIADPYAGKLLGNAGMSMIRKWSGRSNSRRIDMIHNKPGAELLPSIFLDVKPRPEEMSALVNGTLPENRITPVRDEAYFRWRYNNPLSKYLFLYSYDGGLKGYLVLQSHVYSMESGGSHNILELEAADSSIKIELLNTLLTLMNSGSISTWGNMLDQDSYDFLVSRGFEEDSAKGVKEPPRTVLIRPLNEHYNKIEFRGLNLLDANNWDFQMTYMHDH